MKKLIRRMLASVLTVCMLLGMMPVSARAMDKPFELSGVEKVSYTSGLRSVIVTDDATVKEIVAMLVNSGAQKADINPSTPSGIYFTVYGKDWRYNYWTPANPDSDEKITEIWVNGNAYRTQNNMRPFINLMENRMKQLEIYTISRM